MNFAECLSFDHPKVFNPQAHRAGPCSCVECHGVGLADGCGTCGKVKKPCQWCHKARLGNDEFPMIHQQTTKL